MHFRTLALILLVLAGSTAQGHAADVKQIDIPSQPLARALRQFADQTGLQLAFETALTDGRTSPEVKDELSNEAALKKLLEGTGLRYDFLDSRTVAVFPATAKSTSTSIFLSTLEENYPSPDDGIGVRGAGTSATAEERKSLWQKFRLAQADAAPSAEKPAAPSIETKSSNKLEEIVVTARRIEQSLQDVPMSVTAIGQSDLEKMGAVRFQDYARSVPNLTFSSGPRRLNSSQIRIRGVSPPGELGDPTVGMYFDETPVTFERTAGQPDPNLFDVSRIEVLRGPQGTLYGARTMGGAVRVITNQPHLSEFSSRASADISQTQSGGQNYRIDGMVNLPILTDQLALRVVAGYRSDDGFINNVPPAYFKEAIDCSSGAFPQICGPSGNPASAQTFGMRENVNTLHDVNIRATALWQPANSLRVTVRVWGDDGKELGETSQDSNLPKLTQARPLVIVSNEFERNKFGNYNLQLNWDVGRGEIISSTNYFDRGVKRLFDFSGFVTSAFGLAKPPLTPYGQTVDVEQFTHETRFQSHWAGPVQLLVGAFYDTQDEVFQEHVVVPGSSLLPPPLGLSLSEALLAAGDPATAALMAANGEAIYVSGPFELIRKEEVAVFANGTVDIGRLFGAAPDVVIGESGLRWFESKYRRRSAADGAFGFPAFDVRTSDSDMIPSVGLSWKVNPDSMLYVRGARGYRPGFIENFLLPPQCADDLAALGLPPNLSAQRVQPDKLWNYEAGVKSSLFNRRLSVNAAAYYIAWDDIQQGISLKCGFNLIANAGKASSTGFELEFQSRPTDRISLDLAVGYTDAKLEKDAPALDGRKGDPLTEVPRWTGTAVAEYQVPNIWNNNSGYLRAQYQYVDDIPEAFGDAVNALGGRRPAYGILNFRAGVVAGNWEASWYVNNALNKLPILGFQAFPAPPGVVFESVGQPRTIGISFSRTFD